MILRKLFDWAIGLLPEVSFPAEVTSQIQTASSWAYYANHYLPLDTFLICIGIYITMWVVCIILSSVLKLL